MPLYRFAFTDLVTRRYITDLPLRDVSFDRLINQAGQFTASLSITSPRIAARAARVFARHPDDLSCGSGRIACNVIRNNVIWGRYPIWFHNVGEDDRGPVQIRMQGSHMESFLGQARILTDVGPFAAVDQVEIPRQLITHMQSNPYNDLGIQLQPGLSGVPRDRDVYLGSERAPYGQRISELADVENGFEWIIDPVQDPVTGAITLVWRWGYPKLGLFTSNHVFAQPRHVVGWQEDVDANAGGTAFGTRGDSIDTDVTDNRAPLLSDIALAQDYLDAGWPQLDRVIDYQGVKIKRTLDDYAVWWAATHGGAVRVHAATVRLPEGSTFSPANLGDFARLILDNLWFPIEGGVASFSKSWRVIGMSMRPTGRGKGEECRLIFEEAA